MVQEVQKTLRLWLDAVERCTEVVFRDNSMRQTGWKRAFRPPHTLKTLNWERRLDRVAEWVVSDWNTKNQTGDEPLTLTGAELMRGRKPPGGNMRPSDAADLQQPPVLAIRSHDYLAGYLNELTKGISNAQDRHFTAERSLREIRATTYESLGVWPLAAAELERLARANIDLSDYVYAVRAMLRRGIALYRIGNFDEAKNELNKALRTIRRKLASNVDLRTEIAVWDYLGLCFIRLGESAKALRDIYLHPEHRKRTRLLSTPLGDASRLVRMGIAYLELDRFDEAKDAFLLGAKKRLSVKAWPEAARALRYLGHWYFRRKNFEKALTVWAIALKRQRLVGDVLEQARLLYQRGEALRHLHELAPGAPNGRERMEGGITSQLFPDRIEYSLLKQIQEKYEDIFDYFPIAKKQYAEFAYFSYRQCIESAKAEGLELLVADARAAINLLSFSDADAGGTQPKLLARVSRQWKPAGVYEKKVSG